MTRAGLVTIVLVVSACDGGSSPTDDALAPPTCTADGTLRWVHDLGGTQVTGEIVSASYAFGNKVSDVEPGTLDVGDVGGRQMLDRVYVEFDRLLVKGATQPADGSIVIGSLALGNCAGTFQSSITALSGDGWTVQLSDLREMPYCGGAEVAGSFAACLIPEPF